jgi:hypothetical protein
MWSGASSDLKHCLVAVLIMALAVSACAGGSMTKNSPAYREGFDDGCSTASAQGAPGATRLVRNAALYEMDQDYRAGWTSGFSSCRMGPH